MKFKHFIDKIGLGLSRFLEGIVANPITTTIGITLIILGVKIMKENSNAGMAMMTSGIGLLMSKDGFNYGNNSSEK